MKFTIVFTTLLCASTLCAKKIEDLKDKREAGLSYGAPSHNYNQAPATYSQGDASAISVGAGYSIGGHTKPSYSFGGQGQSGALQGLSPSGHATIQLAPITLQPGQFSNGDLSQLMSQITHSLNTGGLSLQPSNSVAEFHQGGEESQGIAQGQEHGSQQFSFGGPKYELSHSLSSAPGYSSSTKGLGSYTSTGPVLFSPNDQQAAGPASPSLTYGSANSGLSLGDAGAYSLGSAGHSLGGAGHSFDGSAHSFGGSGHSLGGPIHSLGSAGHSLGNAGHSLGGAGQSLGGSGHSFGDSGHSLGLSGLSLGGSGHSHHGSGLSLGGSGLSLGGSGHSHGGSGHSLSGSGHSLGGSGHSLGSSAYSLPGLNFGGSGHSFGGYKQLSGIYAPNKASFKPSAFLGSSSIQSESGHGISSLSGSYGAPSFGGFRGTNHGGSSSHGSAGFGSSLGGYENEFPKFAAYQSAKSGGLESASGFSKHYASPPGTTYGTPSSVYSPNHVHSASSNVQRYASPKYRASSSSFGHGSSAYRAPAGSHSSFSSYSSGPKYGFSGSSSQYEGGDAHGSASENSYNTIKYSEELKPQVN